MPLVCVCMLNVCACVCVVLLFQPNSRDLVSLEIIYAIVYFDPVIVCKRHVNKLSQSLPAYG